MIPVLYKSDASNFNTNGIGLLNDAETCKCKEKLNGQYELELKIYKDCPYALDIAEDCIIKEKPNYDDPPQLFRIYSVERNSEGDVVCKAAHISYDTIGLPILPFTAANLDEVVDNLNTNRKTLNDSNFVFSANFSKDGEFKVESPTSFRSLLGDSEGSIVNVYEGEYHYDNFTINLLEKRGNDKGICFRYGKNITSFEHEANTENRYSAILGFWKKNDTVVYGSIIECGNFYGYDKIFILDTSNDVNKDSNSTPTSDQIDEFVTDYISKNPVGVPEIKMKIDYIDDERITHICVGDTVGVIYPEYNINLMARCNTVTYDCLAERNESIEIGVDRKDLSDTIADLSK